MFYLFHGDDTHSQLETLADLKVKMGDLSLLDLNTTRLEGNVTLSELQQAASAMPFLAPVRLVIVQDLLSGNPPKTLLDQLTAYLPQLPETTRLFFLESKALRATHPLRKLAETADTGYARQFDRPQGSSLEKWIRDRVAGKGGRFSSRAVHLLAANVGSELETLDNEIEKLLLYRGEGEEVTAEDVTLLSPYAAEASIFDLVDALGNRNGKQAATLLQQKFNEGTDPFYLFSMFMRQFRLLLQVKELADQGQRPPAIAKQLKLHAFVAGKLHQQSQGFSLSQLEHIYRHLLDVDVGVKTGRSEMTTALNLLVAGLTLDD